MKEIKAYIHNHRIADVIRALKESGLCNTDGTSGLPSSRCKAC